MRTDENKSPDARENDGFSSSDGEFEKEIERITCNIYERRILRLRNQLRRERTEHSNEIAEKDEKIENLKSLLMEQKINIIQLEANTDNLELERRLKEKDQQLQTKDRELLEMRQCLQEKSHQLQVKNREMRTISNQLHYIEQQSRDKDQELQEKVKELQNNKKTIQEMNKRLQDKIAANEELASEVKRLSHAANDFDLNNQTQMASQMAYGNLERNSTNFFNDKHVVPKHLAAERHEYAKNYRFWEFDDGPIEYKISYFHDRNFQNAYKLLGEMAKDRVEQIFKSGRFLDKNGTHGRKSSLVLSDEKRLALDFERKPDFTMTIRRLEPGEIQQNWFGQNNHFRGRRM